MIRLNLGVSSLEGAVRAEHGGIVALENARNLHAHRAGLAVLAARAARFRPRKVRCFDLLVERKFLVSQRRALRHVENAQIIRHLLPCAHAAENRDDFRHSVQVAEAPLDRAAPHGICVVNRFHIHRGIRKQTAAQGFHDDDTHAAPTRFADALKRRLILIVEDVHLHLTHAPLIPVVQDAQERLCVVMEGEAGIAHLALRDSFSIEAFVVQLLHCVHALVVHCVKNVKVHIGGIELFQLLVEKLHHVLMRLDEPDGQLCCQDDLLAVAVLERLADNNFAFAAVIRIRRVDVADAVVDGVANHANRFGFVNFAVRCCWKAHTAEAEHGAFPVDGRKHGVQHVFSLPYLEIWYYIRKPAENQVRLYI